MSLRGKFVLYLVIIHLVFAGVTAVFLYRYPGWLLAVELFFLVSFAVGFWLVRSLFAPIDLIRTAVEFIRDGDFATRLREVGQPELDPLIRVYNRMVDNLRQERTHSEEQEYFLQRIIQASPSGIVTLDLNGKVTMANPAAAGLLKSADADLLGRSLGELGSPLADRLEGLEIDESTLVSLQGKRRIRCHALSFMDRGFARKFVIMDEMTEELHRSEKAAYEKLIRMMSHEVGNTASAVGSLLDSCLAYREQLSSSDREDFVRALGVAISRTGRMNEFVQGFADVVRLPTPHRRPTDLRALLEDNVRLFREECERRKIRWRWEVSDAVPPVDLDPVQMEQVFVNIFKNAVEAIDREGTIVVRLDVDRGRPVVTIRDSGGGIPPEIRDQLFTPFFTSKKDGQGIGLTLSQEILLAHGFDYSLDSDTDGHTDFTIAF